MCAVRVTGTLVSLECYVRLVSLYHVVRYNDVPSVLSGIMMSLLHCVRYTDILVAHCQVQWCPCSMPSGALTS